MDLNHGFIFEQQPKTLLRVTGEDVFGFLQGQFTNELRQPPGSATYGLWLNQKGRVVADSTVLRVAENEFLLLSANTPVSELQQRLEDYIVADDVVLRDETEAAGGLVIGGEACGAALEAVFGAVPLAGHFVRSGERMIYRGQRLRSENYEVFGSASSLTGGWREQLAQRGFAVIGLDEMERRRIADGVPAVPQDLGLTDLPNEGGLDESAISYTKGCYLGQEVMARLKNLGQVRRRLHVMRGEGTRPQPRTALYQGQKKSGELRSVAGEENGFVAFAMLSLINHDPKAGFSFTPDGEPAVWIGTHE